MPEVIAHRGHSKVYPENTILAFQKAISAGADGFETDVHFTEDRQLIVHHRYELGATDNGVGFVQDWTKPYLQALDCGGWKGKQFEGETMPALEDVLELFGSQTKIEIELKAFGGVFAEAVLNEVIDRDLLSSVRLTSYQYPLLAYLKNINREVKVGLIAQRCEEWMDRSVYQGLIESSLTEGIIDAIHVPIKFLDKPFVSRLKSYDVGVQAGQVDTVEELEKAVDLNVDNICTNDLELALKVVKGSRNL